MMVKKNKNIFLDVLWEDRDVTFFDGVKKNKNLEELFDQISFSVSK